VKTQENGTEIDTTGGWHIQKATEPIKAIPETELIQEMRLMHIDFVEEAYWKRLVALKLAQACKKKILDKLRVQTETHNQVLEPVHEIE
jgi:hypothetical protein